MTYYFSPWQIAVWTQRFTTRLTKTKAPLEGVDDLLTTRVRAQLHRLVRRHHNQVKYSRAYYQRNKQRILKYNSDRYYQQAHKSATPSLTPPTESTES